MLLVLTTQLHGHNEPTDNFLLKNPQFGYDTLLNQARNQGVYLNAPIRARMTESHEEYIEDLSWIVSAINFARAKKIKLFIHYINSKTGQLYDFTNDEAILTPFTDVSEEKIQTLHSRPTYIGIYDHFNHLINRSALYYNLNQTFLNHSGRRVLTLNTSVFASTADLFRKILWVASSNDQYIWIKSQEGKKYSEKFSITEIEDYLNHNKDSSKIESFVYMTNQYTDFIVSNYIEMSDEHRFFVVNNQIVEGSKHIPELTPVKYKTPGYNNNLHSVQSKINPELLTFAKKRVAEIAKDIDNMPNTNYVIDIAYNNYKEPIIVEFNPIFNAGVYAANPQVIISALLSNSGL